MPEGPSSGYGLCPEDVADVLQKTAAEVVDAGDVVAASDQSVT